MSEEKRVSERLTSAEMRTYQSLVARGVAPEDALQDALDGVDIRDVRDEFRRTR